MYCIVYSGSWVVLQTVILGSGLGFETGLSLTMILVRCRVIVNYTLNSEGKEGRLVLIRGMQLNFVL